MQKKHDITGKQFGYLEVLFRDPGVPFGERNSKWICKCKCGNITSVARCSLVSGHTTSCGCKHFESHNAKHGMCRTRVFRIWASMNERCRNLHKNNFKYIARGITVCPEWKESFENFYKWAMSNGYSDELSIERINNDKGYSPDNCKWIPRKEQQSNKTNTLRIFYKGEERCLGTVCAEIGFPYKTAHKRYHRMCARGELITPEKLFAPIQKKKIAKLYRRS